MLPPIVSPLGLTLWVVAIVLVVKSPKKLLTAGCMAGGFLGTFFLFLIWGPVLRMGDARASVRIGGMFALLVAVIVGWLHRRSRHGADSTH